MTKKKKKRKKLKKQLKKLKKNHLSSDGKQIVERLNYLETQINSLSNSLDRLKALLLDYNCNRKDRYNSDD